MVVKAGTKNLKAVGQEYWLYKSYQTGKFFILSLLKNLFVI